MESQIFEDRAIKFSNSIEGYAKQYNEQEFLGRLNEEIGLFRKNSDKIVHLRNIEIQFAKRKAEHELKCPQEPGDCPLSKKYDKCMFFVTQELENIAENYIDQSYFSSGNADLTPDQISELHEKIDTVLSRLEMLGLGQEIIFNEIEELKSASSKVSMKDFQLLLLGKLVAFGESKLMGEKSIQDLFGMAGKAWDKMISN